MEVSMNKFLVLISISALFVVSNSFGVDGYVCADKAADLSVSLEAANSVNKICEQTCKSYSGWNGSGYLTDDSDCPPLKFSCKCNSSTTVNVATLDFPT